MANKWGIPKETEKIVRIRDSRSVYCGVNFSITHKSRKTKPTWEHIVNDIRITSKENIALCCTSCNASKGAKLLEDWLKSDYCIVRNISKETVAPVIKNAIIKPPSLSIENDL